MNPHTQHTLAYYPVSVQTPIYALLELLGYARCLDASPEISMAETTRLSAVNHILCLEDWKRHGMRVLELECYPQGSIIEVTDGEVIYKPNSELPRVTLSNSSYLKNLVKLK